MSEDASASGAGVGADRREPAESTHEASAKPSLPAGRYSRHILLCADQTKPNCAPRDDCNRSWDFLKKRLSVAGLASGEGCVYRSKVNCLRVCEQGPIAVVYPEGVWYHSVTPEVVGRIVDEHIAGGRPVEEFVFARNPLACEDDGGGSST